MDFTVRDAIPWCIGRAPRYRARCVAAAITVAGPPAGAAPNVPIDDPVYEQLDQLALTGDLPLFRGGLAPLTEARVRELSPDAPELPTGVWLRPLERAALRAVVSHEAARDYSTVARPRNVAGMLALSCADQEGRPCGNGLGLAAELDSAAGYGAWLSGAIRLRAQTGRDRYATTLDLDRVYVDAELGPVAVEAGRDILVLGPAAHTQLGWGSNAPPLDHVRVSSARPLAISSELRASVVYVVGRLAAPQAYPGDLVSIARGQLDIAERLELGAMQLLQLGGAGAPGFGLRDFVLEHVRRRDPSASASDSSNRRLGFDASLRTAALGGTRVTYQLVFEDLRHEMISAIRYDADHALEIATRWLAIEWQKTGARAYEHVPRTTGFTTAGRIVGASLGPGAHALSMFGRIVVPGIVITPWVQVARLATDTYAFGDGPIVRTGSGPAELRVRIGVGVRLPVSRCVELDGEIAVEDVERAAFVPGVRRDNVVLRALLVWRPSATLTSSGVM